MKPAGRIHPEGEGSVSTPVLTIRTLGGTAIETSAGVVMPGWLDQRPGQLLKFLVAERDHVVTVDQIAEALWPHGNFAPSGTVRHLVHVLRSHIEPDRRPGQPAKLLRWNGKGYAFSPKLVSIDASLFLERSLAALGAFAEGRPARAQLEAAVALYRGEFLADEPYASWALRERERLHDLAGRLLRALADVELEAGRPVAALEHVERLSAMEPFDNDIHRQLIALALALGRRSWALRQYRAYELRLLRAFDERPDFELADVRPSLPRRLAADEPGGSAPGA